MLRKCAVVLGALTLAALTACAGSGDQYRPPSYATAVGDFDWEVMCGTSRIVVMRTSVEQFQKEDGTDKTRAEFCDQYGSDTRIGR